MAYKTKSIARLITYHSPAFVRLCDELQRKFGFIQKATVLEFAELAVAAGNAMALNSIAKIAEGHYDATGEQLFAEQWVWNQLAAGGYGRPSVFRNLLRLFDVQLWDSRDHLAALAQGVAKVPERHKRDDMVRDIYEYLQPFGRGVFLLYLCCLELELPPPDRELFAMMTPEETYLTAISLNTEADAAFPFPGTDDNTAADEGLPAVTD